MKISACIPVYDAPPDYLRAAIDSALSQRGDFELEIVVSDDASVADYGLLERSYLGKPVAFYRNERNLGMAGNWNAAVSRSDGQLIIVVGHDDVLGEGMFAAYHDVFTTHPDVVLCSSGRTFIGADGARVPVKRAVNDRSNIFQRDSLYLLEHREVVRLCLRNGNVIGEPSAVMFRRSVYDGVGGYDPAFEHAADVHFNLRAAAHGRVAYLRHPYLLRRMHGDNLTKSNRSAGKLTRDRAKLYELFSRGCRFSRRELAEFRAHLVARSAHDALQALRLGELRAGGVGLAKAARYARPTPLVYLRYLDEIRSGHNRDAR